MYTYSAGARDQMAVQPSTTTTTTTIPTATAMKGEHSFMASSVSPSQPASYEAPPPPTRPMDPQPPTASSSAGGGNAKTAAGTQAQMHPSFRRQRASRACESKYIRHVPDVHHRHSEPPICVCLILLAEPGNGRVEAAAAMKDVVVESELCDHLQPRCRG